LPLVFSSLLNPDFISLPLHSLYIMFLFFCVLAFVSPKCTLRRFRHGWFTLEVVPEEEKPIKGGLTSELLHG
jgi:hypothetical protein